MRNRLFLSICLALGMVAAGSAFAVFPDWVDIGVGASETGHNMQGWGPPEPATSGGVYGGIDDCRAIWYYIDPTTTDPKWADIDLDFGPNDGGYRCLHLYHLEGLAVDDFEVWIGGNLFATIFDNNSSEIWLWDTVTVNGVYGVQTVRLEALGPAWPSFNPYGQVCFAEIGVSDCVVAGPENTWGAVKSLYR